VNVANGTVSVSGTITVNQGTNPWVVSDTALDATISTPDSTAPTKTVQVGGKDNLGKLRALSLGDGQNLDCNINNVDTNFPVIQVTSPWVVSCPTDIEVTQDTAADLNATVVGTGTFAVQATLAAETTKVIGTVNQGTSPWVVSCPTDVEVVQDTAADLLATVNIRDGSGTGITSTGAALDVNLKTSSITLPVSIADAGGVEVVQDTAADLLATVNLRDGSGNSITSDTRGSARPLAVEIVDASGNQITSFGSSTVTANQGTAAANTAPWPVRPGSPTTAAWSSAVISFNTSGANVIVSGIGGKTIRVMRMMFLNNGASTNITIQDTTPTNLSGAMTITTNGIFAPTVGTGEPYYVSATGTGIQLNSSVATQISGTVWFTQS
jgi:hypothetical protein